MSRGGRPRKRRPQRGDSVTQEMSQRDISAAVGITRRKIALALDLATIPDDEFEQLVESPEFKVSDLKKLARLRAGKSAFYERKCPHCGGIIRLEGI